MAEDRDLADVTLERLAEMAKDDDSAMVRLYLASAMQRIAPGKRWDVLSALLQREEDEEDHNIPLMLWYAFEPAVPTDVERALEVAQSTGMASFLDYTVQRVG